MVKAPQAVKPRKIVPILPPASAQAPAGQGLLVYHGGHLLTSVEVFTIFWGSAWKQAAQTAVITRVNQFFDYILTSPLMDVLSQYSAPGQAIGHGRRTGTTTIVAKEPGRAVAGGGREVTDTAIHRALKGWIKAGTVPAPNANTLYFVYLPPGVTSVFQGERSCSVFCGYHEHAGNGVYYAVEPFLTCQGCTFGQAADSLTKVTSHELCEAITDPAGDGWFEDVAPGNEIGDICNGDVQQLGGFTIQSEWSNAANACRIQP